jgi:hypothetical protein
MDIISHGLWGGAAFGRKSRKNFWTAFFFGIAPDLFSFGIYTVASILGIGKSPQRFGQQNMHEIPQYVGQLYNVTHSLVVFLVVFLLIALWRKKPQWLLGAWGLHILVDIPTHAATFFPTPIFWPLSDFHFNGISWGNPIIFFPNWALLIIVYAFWYFRSRSQRQVKQR